MALWRHYLFCFFKELLSLLRFAACANNHMHNELFHSKVLLNQSVNEPQIWSMMAAACAPVCNKTTNMLSLFMTAHKSQSGSGRRFKCLFFSLNQV